MSDIQKRLRAAEAIILKRMKTMMQQAPIEISAFVGEFLRDPSDKAGLRKSKSGNLYYTIPNTTDRLRTLYGNIQRAITVRGKGNYNSVEYRNGHFYLEFGYDPSTTVRSGTRTQTLEYAVINEATRPFLQPGFSKYLTDPSGWDSLRQQFEDMLIEELRNVFYGK